MRISLVIVVLLSLTYPNNIFSQSKKIYAHDLLLPANPGNPVSFGFSILTYIVNKAKTQALSGNYHLSTSSKHGFEAGPDIYINLSANYSLLIGLHGGAAATNYILFIPGSDFNPSLGADVDDRGKGPTTGLWSFYMDAPIWLQKRWFRANHSFWNFVAGINVRYYPLRKFPYGVQEIFTDNNGNQMTVLYLNASIGNNLRPWLNYNIGGGYSLLLRNNNYLQCNLLVNFSGEKIVNGTYEINVTGKPQSTGTYSANLAYAGVSFSYIFTGANKRLRKMYEEKLKKNQ